MSATLDDVRAKAAKASAELSKYQAEIDRVETERRQRLDARHHAWRQAIIDGYPARRRQLEQQATAARDAFSQAVATDWPVVGAAYLTWVHAAAELAAIVTEYINIQMIADPRYFDEHQAPIIPSAGRVPPFGEAVETAMARAAANVVADIEDASQAAMDRALSDDGGDDGR